MIRVFVLYREAPGAERYEQHAELCRRVPGATFRHGKVLRTLHGAPELGYYAEFEFPDMAAFQTFMQTDQAAEAMKHDGVRPETLLVLDEA